MIDQAQWVPTDKHPDGRILLGRSVGSQALSIGTYREMLLATGSKINGNGEIRFDDGSRITQVGINSTLGFLNSAQFKLQQILERGAVMNQKGEEVPFVEGYGPDRIPRVNENLRRFGYDVTTMSLLRGAFPVSSDVPSLTKIFTLAPNAARFVRLVQRRGKDSYLSMGETEYVKADNVRSMLAAKVGNLIRCEEQIPYLFPMQPVTAVLQELTSLNSNS